LLQHQLAHQNMIRIRDQAWAGAPGKVTPMTIIPAEQARHQSVPRGVTVFFVRLMAHRARQRWFRVGNDLIEIEIYRLLS